MANYEFITLRYSNSCDIGDVVFQNGFTYELNVIGVLGEPKYEHIERVNENEDKEISFNAKTLKKTITLLTIGNEQRLDVFNFIRLCDTKILVNKAGQVYNINEMQVEADLSSGIALIKVQFVLFTVTNTICCSNNIVNNSLDNYILLNKLYIGKKLEGSSGDVTGDRCLYLDENGKYHVIIKVDTINNSGLPTGWNYVIVNASEVYKYLSNYYQKNLHSAIVSEIFGLPIINEITLDSGTTYSISGQSLQGYIVGFQVKPSGGTYANVNINSTSYNYTTSLNFNGSGVKLTISGSGFKVRCYLASISAPTTPLCYSNEAIYVP